MDQLINAAIARALHADACRAHSLMSRVVTRDPNTLAEIHAQLPAELARAGRQPTNPPEVVESWFPP